jgi:hypothetical protein
MVTTGDGSVRQSASGTTMVQLASYLLWGVFFVFEVIAGDYYVANVGLVIAAAVIALPRLAPKAIEVIASVAAFTKVSGYLLAFSGVIELLDDIRFDSYDGFVSVLGAVLAYVAYVMAFVGARSIED